jgi:hypothetical protein
MGKEKEGGTGSFAHATGLRLTAVDVGPTDVPSFLRKR